MSAICANTSLHLNLASYLTASDSGNPPWPDVVWWNGIANQTTLLIPGTWSGTGSGWDPTGMSYSSEGYTVQLVQNSSPVYTAFFFLYSSVLNPGQVTPTVTDGSTTYDLTLVMYNTTP